jgi:hypothetical protein
MQGDRPGWLKQIFLWPFQIGHSPVDRRSLKVGFLLQIAQAHAEHIEAPLPARGLFLENLFIWKLHPDA